MKKQGFTLLEIMMATAVFTIVMGVIVSLSLGFASSAQVQEAKITTNDEARRALLILTPRLRQAARDSINWNDLPGDSITFQMAVDLTGNGSAVDENGDVELSGVMIVQRDANDANNDGMTMTQLIMQDGNTVRVLANNLAEGASPQTPGVNAPDDVGFWVAPRGNGLEVTVRAIGRTVRGHEFNTTFTEFIVPRN